MVVAWGRKSYLGPAATSSLCTYLITRRLGCRMSQRFHLAVSEVLLGNEYFMCKRVGTKMRYEKILFRSSASC